MSFDFPNSPTNGQVFTPTGGPVYVYTGGVWRMQGSGQVVTAEARNRIVNGAMQISQENARGTNLTALGNYPADQWLAGGNSDGTISGYANVPNAYIGADAGPYCITCVIGTADAAMAAGQYLQFGQIIEGTRVSDFNWGTANALPIVVRFKATSTIATTFSVSLRATGSTRSYVKNLTIAAATPTWFTVVIPGDVTGTWAIDNTWGIYLTINLAVGATYTAPAEGWNAGNFLAAPGISNFWANGGARFSFGAVGLYLDPNATGVPPPWQMPDEAEELRACQRYYQRTNTQQTYGMYYPGSLNAWWGVNYPVTMRVAPTLTAWGYTSSNGNVGYNLIGTNSCRLDGGSITTGSAYATFGTIRAARM